MYVFCQNPFCREVLSETFQTKINLVDINLAVLLISKDANLVFYLSVYKLIHCSNSDNDVFIDFCVDSFVIDDVI